jgi:hypothetical protein
MTTGNYLIANGGRICISKLLFSPGELRSDVLECPESIRLEVNETWKIRLSLILIKLIKDASLPLAKLGTWIEFYLNLLSQNGGLLKTLFRRLTGDFIDLFLSSIPAFHVLEIKLGFYPTVDFYWSVSFFCTCF